MTTIIAETIRQFQTGQNSREEQTDREILEYAAKAFGKDTVSSK